MHKSQINTLNRLREYMENPADEDNVNSLHYKDLEVLERLTSIYAMMENKNTSNFIKTHLMEKHGLGESMARLSMAMAIELFGNVNKVSKEAKRHFFENYCMDMMNKCNEKGDYDAGAKWAKNYIVAAQLNGKDDIKITPDMFKQTYVSAGTPDVIDAVTKLLGSKSPIDIETLYESVADDADYEEDNYGNSSEEKNHPL